MIYDSIYKIPSRLFFQIMETGNVSLLNTDFKDEGLEELERIWTELEEADQKLSNNPKTDKFLNTSKIIESLKCRQQKVDLSISYLRILKDDQLIKLIKSEGYKFTGDYKKDLSKFERLNKDLDVKIKKLELKLPKPKDSKKEVFFDDLVIGYGSIMNQTYRANEITQSEFRALEKNVKLKIESIPKPSTPKNGR